MIKFSATITCQYDTPFAPFPVSQYDEALSWVKQSGFDGAEVCISNYDSIAAWKIKNDLDKAGLTCSTISTGQSRILENISLLHDDPEAQKKAQRRIREHIDAAVILGSKVTIGLLRGLGEAKRLEAQKALLLKNILPCVKYAEDKGVTLLIEAINRYETAMLNSAAQTIDFIAEAGGSPSLGILWDLFHANIEDPAFDTAIDAMGGRLRHVHIADSNRYFPGYGHIDFHAVYDKLKSTGFKDYMSFECFNLPSAQEVKDGSRDFIGDLRKR
ncbi:MAG: sugar phosphate isomerase/epimerase family protein [Treponemataceae bacterium]